jgi:phosphoglycolate phosphatase-like HAD superfamily hydrolase
MAVAILDVDGTLVDTNYHHAVAWFRAFKCHGIVLSTWRIHRHVGMGGDQLVAVLAGDDAEKEKGDDIRHAESELYGQLIGEVEPLDGARDLIGELRELGHDVILASSATEDEVDRYIDLLQCRDLITGFTTSDDVEQTKPEPDLIKAAMAKGSSGRAVMVGDSTFDCIAAERAGIPTVGVLTGGFSREELRKAGAVAVYESVREVRERLGDTPLGAG